MPRLSAAVAESVIGLTFAFALAFGRFRAFSGVASVLAAIEAAFTLSFALDKIDLPILLYEMAVQLPALFVNGPATFVAGQR